MHFRKIRCSARTVFFGYLHRNKIHVQKLRISFRICANTVMTTLRSLACISHVHFHVKDLRTLVRRTATVFSKQPTTQD